MFAKPSVSDVPPTNTLGLLDETFIGLKPDWEVTSPRPGLRVFLLGARTTTF